MLKLPVHEVSLWQKKAETAKYPTLNSDLVVDTVIVGGGLCGLSAAYLLAQAGQKVAVLEKDRIGSGTSGHTTGKVTSQHNLFYEDFSYNMGQEAARLYGQANNKAIDEIEKIIKKEKINCGWTRQDHYVYTTKKSEIYKFKEEAKTAQKFGLPASYQTSSPLPFEVKAAVKFASQAYFNAQDYLIGLAKVLSSSGNYVFEKSQVVSIQDNDTTRVATNDFRVDAGNIIIATNVPTFPLLARSAYCILEYPTTSYIVVARVKNKIAGMYISPDQDNYSLLPVPDGSDQLVLVGGLNHIRGLGSKKKRWQTLADYAESHFNATAIDYKWSAWDYIAYDNMPIVGKAYPWSKHLYVATAFKKWGLTNTFVAAQILRDSILFEPNELIGLYTPHRSSAIKAIPKVFARYVGLS